MCAKSNPKWRTPSNILFVLAPSKLIGHLKTQHAGLVTKHFSANKGPKIIGTISYLLYKVLMRVSCIWSSKRENGSHGSWKITFLTWEDMHMIFKAKTADTFKFTTSPSQICTTAEPAKAILLMGLKSSRKLEIHPSLVAVSYSTILVYPRWQGLCLVCVFTLAHTGSDIFTKLKKTPHWWIPITLEK